MSMGYGIHGRIPVFFSEPSHFAMSIAPIWGALILCFREFREKLSVFYICMLTISSLLCLSATLAMSILFFLILRFVLLVTKISESRGKYQVYFFASLIIFFLFFMILNSEDVMSRINFFIDFIRNPSRVDNHSFNMSSFTYLNHFLSSINSLKTFNWLGAGLNHYERAYAQYYPFSAFSDLAGFKHWGYLNYNDGLNNFNKLLTEFGVFFFFSLAYLIRRLNFKINGHNILFYFAISNFLVLTFLRSAGYFNAGYIIAIFIILHLGFKNTYHAT